MADKAPDKKKEDKKPIFAYTQGKAWGGPTSTFGSLAFLSVFPLTGLLGLDHLYLRSPASAILKTIFNVITFGMWYLYDAAQILSERDLVEKYGYSYPIVGPTGLGAEILAKGETEEADAEEPVGPSPWRFLALCVFALLPIPFGLEYFAVGDTWGGVTKIISNFSWSFGILQFFSLLSGLYLIFRVFFKTETMLFNDGIPRTFPWTMIMDSDYCPAGTVSPESGCKKDESEESQGWFSFMKGWGANMKWYKKYIEPVATVVNTAKSAVQATIPPAKQAATGALSLAAQAPTIESKVTSEAQAKYTNANQLKELYKKQQGIPANAGKPANAGQQGGALPERHTGATFMQNFAFIAALGLTIATGVYLAKLPSIKELDVSFIFPFSKRKSASGSDDTPPEPTAV